MLTFVELLALQMMLLVSDEMTSSHE